jgi:acetoin utilization deacetylase AcuC-like enzyme
VAIFWDEPSILVVSIHADPAFDYPYNAGFADQIGGPSALNATLNIPLPPMLEWPAYRVELQVSRSMDQRGCGFGSADSS